jgi:hypothetical protein
MSADSDTYKCAECGGTFTKGWSDDEADAEALQTLGVRMLTPGTALVCDDCYPEILRRRNEGRNGRERES